MSTLHAHGLSGLAGGPAQVLPLALPAPNLTICWQTVPRIRFPGTVRVTRLLSAIAAAAWLSLLSTLSENLGVVSDSEL